MNVCTYFKNVAEQGIAIPNWSKTFQTFWSRPPVFALKTQPKNLSFHNFFISKWIASGYFQGNVCTHFQNKLAEKVWLFQSYQKPLDYFGRTSPFLH